MKFRIDKAYKKIKKGSEGVKATIEGRDYLISIAWQTTGYGSRPLFLCPTCGKRRRDLYYEREGTIKCRSCLPRNIYRGIQHTTRGGYEYIEYKLQRLSEKVKLNNLKIPFDYEDYPWFTDTETLKVLQGLENMREQSIFFGTIFSPKVVSLVENGKHPNLKDYPLWALKKNLYPW